MAQALVKFTRDNAEDEEYAKKDFPSHPLKEALVKQFIKEVSLDKELLQGMHLINSFYTEEQTTIYCCVELCDRDTMEEFRERLQRTYDMFGLNGQFDIVHHSSEDRIVIGEYVEIHVIARLGELPFNFTIKISNVVPSIATHYMVHAANQMGLFIVDYHFYAYNSNNQICYSGRNV